MHHIFFQFSCLGDPLGHHCLQCDMKFPNYASLKNHVFRNHNDDQNEFKCSICGSTFKNRSGLYKHRSSVHIHGSYTSKYRLFCHICEAGFNEDSKLDEHVALHNSTQEFACVYCSSSKLHGFVR